MNSAGPIGGYFELELGPGVRQWHTSALRFQSARAAFLSLLMGGRPTRVWMPWFICDAMIEPLRMCGIDHRRYSLSESLDVEAGLVIAAGEWLLYPNYFGLGDRQVDAVLKRFRPDQVVIDNAQA